jgi:hypothetical protein
MAGVGTALKAGYDIVFGRQYIHNFTFTFVSPLKA